MTLKLQFADITQVTKSFHSRVVLTAFLLCSVLSKRISKFNQFNIKVKSKGDFLKKVKKKSNILESSTLSINK